MSKSVIDNLYNFGIDRQKMIKHGFSAQKFDDVQRGKSSYKIDDLILISETFDLSLDYLIGRIPKSLEILRRTPHNIIKSKDKFFADLKTILLEEHISDLKTENIIKIVGNLLEMVDEASEEAREYTEYLSQKGRYDKPSTENGAKND